LRVADPGKVEGNVVFAYLDAFDPDRAAVEELKRRYQRGGLGDAVVKRRLNDVLQSMLAPMRERRLRFARDLAEVDRFVDAGTQEARAVAARTLSAVRGAFGLARRV
jgi:tryptophanyl-tRNA synthetase